MQSAEDAVNSGALLPDDTWEPVDDSNSSDDELNPISYEDKVINEVYGTVWDGWENYDPDHPEWDEITYGMVMDYLFEDSTYYQWSYDRPGVDIYFSESNANNWRTFTFGSSNRV